MCSRSAVSDSLRLDCSLPGSSVHGLFQEKYWSCLPFSSSRGSSPPRNRTQVSCVSHTAGSDIRLMIHTADIRNWVVQSAPDSSVKYRCARGWEMQWCVISVMLLGVSCDREFLDISSKVKEIAVPFTH